MVQGKDAHGTTGSDRSVYLVPQEAAASSCTHRRGSRARAKRGRANLLRLALAAALALIFALPGRTSTASVPPLKEISYYPRNHAWLKFWEEWADTREEMEEDLDLIRDLGANTVRIFVHPSAFNYPRAPTRAQLDRLEEALVLIDAHGLQAHVNLFDCWWSWSESEASKDWMAAIVGPHRDDPRIALWELQNEVPLYDREGRKTQAVHAWVRELFPSLKEQAGSTPCSPARDCLTTWAHW